MVGCLRFHVVLSAFLFFMVILFRPVGAFADTAYLMIATGKSVQETAIGDAAFPNQSAFRPHSNGKNLGFVKEDVWIWVGSQSVEAGKFLLIQPVHVDRVQVYAADGTLVFEGGDTVPSPRSLIAGGYTVPISDVMADQDVFIRFSSRNIMQPYISIDAPDYLFKRFQGVILTSAIAVSISLFYFAWAASAALTAPNALIVAFGIRLLAFIATSAIHSGLMRHLIGGNVLPPQDLAHNFSALAYITVAQIFDYFLLRETVHRRVAQAFAAVVVASALTKFGLFFGRDVSAALQVNNLTALLTLALGLVCAPLSNGRNTNGPDTDVPKIGRFVPTFYFLLQAVPLAGLFALTAIGSTRYLEYAELAFLNYAVVPGGFIVYVLAVRQRQQKAERLQLEQLAEAAKRQDISNLLNMLTHEIKTPLATLQMAQAIGEVDEVILSKTTRSISQAITQADRVEELEQGQPMVEFIPVDLCAAVKTAIANSYGPVTTDCGDQTVQVTTDPGLLHIILNNLIGNATKYCRTGTVPAINLKQSDTMISVIVVNDLNKPLVSTDRLTEKYYRDPTSKGASGTGLGLYIVSLLSDHIGCGFDIEASQNQFRVILTFKAKDP